MPPREEPLIPYNDNVFYSRHNLDLLIQSTNNQIFRSYPLIVSKMYSTPSLVRRPDLASFVPMNSTEGST